MTVSPTPIPLAGTLDIDLKGYMPLIIMVAVLGAVFLLFKLFNVSTKLLWRLLINGLLGAFMLFAFNLILSNILDMDFFELPITWTSAVVAGVLGVPGILLLLLLKVLL